MQKIITTQASSWAQQISNRDFINKRAVYKKTEKKISTASLQPKKFPQYKNEHIAYVSHELRSPLTGIVGALEQLQHSQLTDEQHELVKMATQSADYLLELLNNLLDFSRIEANQAHLNIEEVNILELLDQAIQTIYLKACRKKLQLKVIVMPDVPRLIKIDSLSFRQILINLLSNAVKFTDQGHITITARCHKQQLRIHVADTGRGIGQKIQDKLFHPYVQEHTNGMGMGLGLCIAARLTKKMGGVIQLESVPAQGTCFTVLLPITVNEHQECRLFGAIVAPLPLHGQLKLWGLLPEVGDNPELTAKELICMPGRLWKTLTKNKYSSVLTSRWSADCGSDFHKNNTFSDLNNKVMPRWNFKILIVDDIEVNRKLIMTMLQQLGNTCVLAANGIEALALGREQSFDMVLMDLYMPKMDGFKATTLWRSAGQGILSPDCPIIGLSSSMPAQKKDVLARKIGMDSCITKPVNVEKLSAVMRLVEVMLQARELDVESLAYLDSPLLDSFDKETRKQINAAVTALHDELTEAYLQRDEAALKDRMHALKGLAGQAGLASAAKKIEHMESALLRQIWPNENDLKILKSLVLSEI